MQTGCQEKPISISNKISLEINNDTTETNLLDETSKFEKCLTPLSDYTIPGKTSETHIPTLAESLMFE